jgi:hypothetical protein
MGGGECLRGLVLLRPEDRTALWLVVVVLTAQQQQQQQHVEVGVVGVTMRSFASRNGTQVGLVRLQPGTSILQQLHAEEALFKRRPQRSYLLLHHSAPPAGTPPPPQPRSLTPLLG